MRAVRLGSYSMCATLAGTPEVDETVGTLVPAALVPGGDPAVNIPATLGVERSDQRLLGRRAGELGEIGHRGPTTTRSGRLVFTDTHSPLVLFASGAGEDLDRLAVRRQRDDRALGCFALSEAGPGALALALPVERVHRGHLDIENLLDGNLDLGLISIRVHQEGVPAGLEQAVALLGNHRRQDDVARIGDHFASSTSVGACADSAVAASTRENVRRSFRDCWVKTTSSLTRTS